MSAPRRNHLLAGLVALAVLAATPPSGVVAQGDGGESELLDNVATLGAALTMHHSDGPDPFWGDLGDAIVRTSASGSTRFDGTPIPSDEVPDHAVAEVRAGRVTISASLERALDLIGEGFGVGDPAEGLTELWVGSSSNVRTPSAPVTSFWNQPVFDLAAVWIPFDFDDNGPDEYVEVAIAWDVDATPGFAPAPDMPWFLEGQDEFVSIFAFGANVNAIYGRAGDGGVRQDFASPIGSLIRPGVEDGTLIVVASPQVSPATIAVSRAVDQDPSTAVLTVTEPLPFIETVTPEQVIDIRNGDRFFELKSELNATDTDATAPADDDGATAAEDETASPDDSGSVAEPETIDEPAAAEVESPADDSEPLEAADEPEAAAGEPEVAADEPEVDAGEPADEPAVEEAAAEPITDDVADPQAVDQPATGGDSGSGVLLLVGLLLGLAAVGVVVYVIRRKDGTIEVRADPPTTEPSSTLGTLVTPAMAEWGALADAAFAAALGTDGLVGDWVFTESDPCWITADEEIPEGVISLRALPDGDGWFATFPIPHRRYHVRHDGRARQAGDRVPVAATIEVSFYQDETTMQIPVVYALVVDRRRSKGASRIIDAASSRAPRELRDRIAERHGGGLYIDGDLSRPDPELIAAEPSSPVEAFERAARGVVTDGRVELPDRPGLTPSPPALPGVLLTVIDLDATQPPPLPSAPPSESGELDAATSEPDPERSVPPTRSGGSLAHEYRHLPAMQYDVQFGPLEDNVAATALALSSDEGVVPIGDWMPISRRVWCESVAMAHLLPAPTDDPDRFSGRFVHRDTLEILEATDDPQRAATYERLVRTAGYSPTADQEVYVVANGSGCVLTCDEQGQVLDVYPPRGANSDGAKRIFDNLELNDTLGESANRVIPL